MTEPSRSRGAPLAIVTGASSGMGAAVARLLARRGMRTVLIARRKDLLDALAMDLSRLAPSHAVALDMADAARVGRAMEEVVLEHGPASVLLNAAGYGHYATFLEHAPEDHRRLMEVNYFSAVEAIRAVLPGMVGEGRGHVVNVASMSTKMGPWGHAGYAAAKSALVSLTQTLAAEHAGTGVRFSYVNPGIVATEYFEQATLKPLHDLVRRHSIPTSRAASAIVGLLDRPRLELCIPRHYRVMDWLRALHPGLAHRIVAAQSRPRRG